MCVYRLAYRSITFLGTRALMAETQHTNNPTTYLWFSLVLVSKALNSMSEQSSGPDVHKVHHM